MLRSCRLPCTAHYYCYACLPTILRRCRSNMNRISFRKSAVFLIRFSASRFPITAHCVVPYTVSCTVPCVVSNRARPTRTSPWEAGVRQCIPYRTASLDIRNKQHRWMGVGIHEGVKPGIGLDQSNDGPSMMQYFDPPPISRCV